MYIANYKNTKYNVLQNTQSKQNHIHTMWAAKSMRRMRLPTETHALTNITKYLLSISYVHVHIVTQILLYMYIVVLTL